MHTENFDIKSLLNFIETNYRLDRETILEIIELSILKAASKNKQFSSDLHVEIDRNDYSIHIHDSFIIDDEIVGSGIMTSKLAKHYTKKDDIKEGDIVKIDIPVQSLGRICARDTRMMILQKVKATKNQNIISEYQNKIGHVVTGIVSGFDKGSIIFTVNGNIDMIIPQNEKIFNEKYKIGDTISGVIIRINEKQRYSPIIVSRADELFVEELMRQEIPEVNEGKVKIMKLKRYPGFRTKVIVKSEDSKLDAIGACVGRNGLRIKNIMNEFQRERLDLIRYSENVVDIVKEALVPINVMDVRIDEVYDTVTVYVDENAHRSLLKKHNKTLLLTSKLIGRKVIAETYLENSSFEAIKDNAIKNISDMLDISMIEAMSVVNSGYTSIECIVEEDLETFIANCGLGEVTASGIHAAATAIVEHLENQEA